MPLETTNRPGRSPLKLTGIAPALMVLALAACAGTPAETPDPTDADASHSPASSESAAPTLQATAEEASEAPAGAIDVLMLEEPAFAFDPDEVTAAAGDLAFFLHNDQDNARMVHNFFIGTDVDSPPLAKSPTLLNGDSVVFTVYGIEPGTYTYWCTVPTLDGSRTHAAVGMTGTLTVTE